MAEKKGVGKKKESWGSLDSKTSLDKLLKRREGGGDAANEDLESTLWGQVGKKGVHLRIARREKRGLQNLLPCLQEKQKT